MKLPGFRYLNFEKLANFPDKWVNLNNETFFFYFYDCTFDSCLREKKKTAATNFRRMKNCKGQLSS